MSRLTDLNQALRRQPPRTTWIPELATPAGAFGECLQRADTPRRSPGTVADVKRPSTGASGLLIALARAVVRAVRRRRTVRMLRQLDAHLLADIGIERHEIDEVAAKAAVKATEATTRVVAAGPARRVGVELVAALRKGWQRQAAIRSLQGLPDWVLADIGIERGRIPESVDSLLANGEQRPPARPEPAVAPIARAAQKVVEAAAPAHRAAA
jgi:uncharacterized protein YjiS (DUF1127 family)